MPSPGVQCRLLLLRKQLHSGTTALELNRLALSRLVSTATANPRP